MRLSVLSDRGFALYCSGNTVAWVGSWMQRTAIGWLSWDLTHSPSWVGLIALAQYLPLVVVGPLFGVMLDRADRKRYAVLIQVVLISLGVALWAVHAVGVLNIHVLFALCWVLGLANSAYQPVRLTLIHDIAPKDRLTQAIGINSILFNTTRLIGPALGGVSIALLSIGATFLISAASHIAAVAALLTISVRSVKPTTQTSGLFSDFSDGLRYALSHRFILELMTLSVITSILARGVLELLPAFAGGEYGRSSGALATLMAAGGSGSIVAGFLLSGAHHERLLVLVRRGCCWSGVAVACFGIIGFYAGAVVVAVALGTLVTLSSVGLQAILQTRIDSSYRGRVVGLWGVTNVAGPSIGGALLGTIAQFAGLKAVTFASGVLCVILSALVMSKSTQFARAPNSQTPLHH